MSASPVELWKVDRIEDLMKRRSWLLKSDAESIVEAEWEAGLCPYDELRREEGVTAGLIEEKLRVVDEVTSRLRSSGWSSWRERF